MEKVGGLVSRAGSGSALGLFRGARRASPFSCLPKKRGEKKGTPTPWPCGPDRYRDQPRERAIADGSVRRDVVSRRTSGRHPWRPDPAIPRSRGKA